MIKTTCIKKYRNVKGEIEGYLLRDSDGIEKNFEALILKDYIRNGVIDVDNLTLTSDNRLVNTSAEDDDSDKESVVTMKVANDKEVKVPYAKLKELAIMDDSEALEYYTTCGHKILAVFDKNSWCVTIYIPDDVEIALNISDIGRIKSIDGIWREAPGWTNNIEVLKLVGGHNVRIIDKLWTGQNVDVLDLSELDLSKCISACALFRGAIIDNIIAVKCGILNNCLFVSEAFGDMCSLAKMKSEREIIDEFNNKIFGKQPSVKDRAENILNIIGSKDVAYIAKRNTNDWRMLIFSRMVMTPLREIKELCEINLRELIKRTEKLYEQILTSNSRADFRFDYSLDCERRNIKYRVRIDNEHKTVSALISFLALDFECRGYVSSPSCQVTRFDIILQLDSTGIHVRVSRSDNESIDSGFIYDELFEKVRGIIESRLNAIIPDIEKILSDWCFTETLKLMQKAGVNEYKELFENLSW